MKVNNVEYGFFNGNVEKIHFFKDGKVVGTIDTNTQYSYLVNADDYSKHSQETLQGITVDAELPSRAKKITMKKKEVCIGKDVDKQDYESCNNALYIHADLVGFEDLGEQPIDTDSDGTKQFRKAYKLHGEFTVKRRFSEKLPYVKDFKPANDETMSNYRMFPCAPSYVKGKEKENFRPCIIHSYDYMEEVKEVIVYDAYTRWEYGEEYKRKEALAEELNSIFHSKKLSHYDITALEKVFTLTRKEALK